MTIRQIEEKYHVKCEKMQNPYSKSSEFWAVKDAGTDEEIGRCATADDICKTMNVIRDLRI